jgi:hypothetical protein
MIDAQAKSERLHKERGERIFSQLNELSTQIRSLEIPPQVLLRQPVTFLDALGRVSPVHLDFIDSTEVTDYSIGRLKFANNDQAFIAVLKVKFKNVGLSKIERREFRLSDPHRNQVLDLRRSWGALMKPGQHVYMSMVFRKVEALQNRCPSCHASGYKVEGAETVW